MLKSVFKKVLFFITLFILFMGSVVFATDLPENNPSINSVNNSTPTTNDDSVYANTTLSVVDNTICTIKIDDYGEFTKRISEFNASEKSVTLELQMKNFKKIEESQKNVEIFFVIDNSSSMLETYDNTTRKQAVINSANSLVEKLFDSNPKVKVGLVGFSSLDFSKGETEGTLADANLRLELSSSENDVKQAITDLVNFEVGPRTNIDAGLTLAKQNFSQDENVSRYIILLTDGVPNNTATGISMTYSGEVSSVTKSTIESIENSGIDIIGAMIALDSEKIEPSSQKTYKELAEEVFGTEENPTLSKYFYINDNDIENTIVNEIFDSLIIRVDNTLKNIVITDYFPQEIIDNFNFEYVASPNIGNVSQQINLENNSITWNIELLSEDEIATLKYKLTLKEDYNQNILDVVLPTNSKVDITGNTPNGESNVSSSDSPTIVVKYDEPEKPAPIENTIDNTIVPNNKLPQTGESTVLIGILLIGLAFAFAIRIYLLNKNTK